MHIYVKIYILGNFKPFTIPLSHVHVYMSARAFLCVCICVRLLQFCWINSLNLLYKDCINIFTTNKWSRCMEINNCAVCLISKCYFPTENWIRKFFTSMSATILATNCVRWSRDASLSRKSDNISFTFFYLLCDICDSENPLCVYNNRKIDSLIMADTLLPDITPLCESISTASDLWAHPPVPVLFTRHIKILAPPSGNWSRQLR